MYKTLVNAQKFNFSEIIHKKSPWWTYKPVNSHSLAIFSSTVRLREVNLALWTSEWVSTSAHERCPFTEGKKCRVLVEKLPGPQFGVRSVMGGVR